MNRRDFMKVSTLGFTGILLISSSHVRSTEKTTYFRLMGSDGTHRFISEQSKPFQVMFYNGSIPDHVLRIPHEVESSLVFNKQLNSDNSMELSQNPINHIKLSDNLLSVPQSMEHQAGGMAAGFEIV